MNTKNVEHLRRVVAEGRLIRNSYGRTDNAGRELFCLYSALAGDKKSRPDSCPAELCTPWVAHLLPVLNDLSSVQAWPGIVNRVVAIADRLPLVSERCEWVVRGLVAREALRYVDLKDCQHVCRHVAALCERRATMRLVRLTVAAAVSAEAWRLAEAAATAGREIEEWAMRAVALAATRSPLSAEAKDMGTPSEAAVAATAVQGLVEVALEPRGPGTKGAAESRADLLINAVLLNIEEDVCPSP